MVAGKVYIEDRVTQLETMVAQLQRHIERTPMRFTADLTGFDLAVELVVARTGVTWPQLTSKNTHQHVVWPRHLLFYLCREVLEMTQFSIGVQVGKDHGTVKHGVQKVKDRMAVNKADHAFVHQLAGELKDSLAQRNGQTQPQLIKP